MLNTFQGPDSVQGGFLGNRLAGNPLTDPRFKIPGGQPWNSTPLLPGNDTKKFEERPLPRPFQLPSAMYGIGNTGTMLAQADPNAAALGGAMRMQPGGIPPGMEEPPNVFSVRPRIKYMDPKQGGLELGGSVNIPIGERGRINMQGGYQPDTRRLNVNATIGQLPGQKGFGVDFTMDRTLGGGSNNRNDLGVYGRYGTQF